MALVLKEGQHRSAEPVGLVSIPQLVALVLGNSIGPPSLLAEHRLTSSPSACPLYALVAVSSGRMLSLFTPHLIL